MEEQKIHIISYLTWISSLSLVEQWRHILYPSWILSDGIKKTFPIPLFDSLCWNKEDAILPLRKATLFNTRTNSQQAQKGYFTVSPLSLEKRASMMIFPLPKRQPCTKHLGMEYVKAVYLSAYMYSTIVARKTRGKQVGECWTVCTILFSRLFEGNLLSAFLDKQKKEYKNNVWHICLSICCVWIWCRLHNKK